MVRKLLRSLTGLPDGFVSKSCQPQMPGTLGYVLAIWGFICMSFVKDVYVGRVDSWGTEVFRAECACLFGLGWQILEVTAVFHMGLVSIWVQLICNGGAGWAADGWERLQICFWPFIASSPGTMPEDMWPWAQLPESYHGAPSPGVFKDTQISHHLRILSRSLQYKKIQDVTSILSRSLCNTKIFQDVTSIFLTEVDWKKELGREKWRQFKGIVEIVDYEKNQDLEVKSVSLTLTCYSGGSSTDFVFQTGIDDSSMGKKKKSFYVLICQ